MKKSILLFILIYWACFSFGQVKETNEILNDTMSVSKSNVSIKLQVYKSPSVDFTVLGYPKGIAISNYSTGEAITSETFDKINIVIENAQISIDEIKDLHFKNVDGNDISPSIMKLSKPSYVHYVIFIQKKYATELLTLILVGNNGEFSPLQFKTSNLTIK